MKPPIVEPRKRKPLDWRSVLVGFVMLACGGWVFIPVFLSGGLALIETPLQEAIVYHEDEKVRQMLKDGADPNSEDNIGWGPLHTALERNIAMADTLLKAGADVNDTNRRGISLIEDMRTTGNAKAIAWLKEHGVKQPATE